MTDAPLQSSPAAPAEFRVDVWPDRDRVRVAPVGELDLATADTLGHTLAELQHADFRRLVLDLRGLSFIDSTGMHLIIDWATRAHENAIDVSIIQGPRAVRRVFELTGTLDRLPFRTTPTPAPVDPETTRPARESLA